MEATLKQNAIFQMETFKQNTNKLLLEGDKIEASLRIMNSCSDSCNLQFRETGIKDKNHKDVSCF